jgi:hypothetical protein
LAAYIRAPYARKQSDKRNQKLQLTKENENAKKVASRQRKLGIYIIAQFSGPKCTKTLVVVKKKKGEREYLKKEEKKKKKRLKKRNRGYVKFEHGKKKKKKKK